MSYTPVTQVFFFLIYKTKKQIILTATKIMWHAGLYNCIDMYNVYCYFWYIFRFNMTFVFLRIGNIPIKL